MQNTALLKNTIFCVKKIIGASLLYFAVPFFLVAGEQEKLAGKPESVKKLQQNTQLFENADKKGEINIGRIYITPPDKSRRGSESPLSPGRELSRLLREQQEISKTLERLERKIKRRKMRSKRVYKRPCV